jgi:uncharacterized protein
MQETIEQIIAYVQTVFEESGSHGFDHTLRVTRLCERLAQDEGADLRVVLPAALLHDIARPLEEEQGIAHEQAGAAIASEFLSSIGYDEALIQKITHAIRTHRYRSTNRPETLEAMVLSDADKLDAMGAVGIARTFMQAGERKGTMADAIDHIQDKLLKLKGRMYTKSARELATARHTVLADFLTTFEAELRIL